MNSANASVFDHTAVENIFLGKTKAFPSGDKAIPIMVDYANPGVENFLVSQIGKSSSQYRALWARLVFAGAATPPQAVPTSQDVVDLVEKNPNLIGIADSAAVKGAVKILVFK